MATKQTNVIEHKLYGGDVTVYEYPDSHIYKVTDPVIGLEKARLAGVTTICGIKDKSGPLMSWSAETAGLHLMDILNAGQSITMDDIRTAIKKHVSVKDEAAEIGKAMHSWCEYFIKHGLGIKGYEADPTLPEDEQILRGVRSFLKWYNECEYEPTASERIIYSRKYQYVGTADTSGNAYNILSLNDFKSSNSLSNTVRMQTAAYAMAIEEEQAHIGQPVEFHDRHAIRLSKESEAQYIERMERKNYIKGNEGKEIPPYDPFEVKSFKGRESLLEDFETFLAAKTLRDWDLKTDFYLNK